jgi:sensor histidine kinase YesM
MKNSDTQQRRHILSLSVWMFFLVASIHTLQIFFELYTGAHTLFNFLLMYLSELVYWMYFPLLFAGIQWVTTQIWCQRKPLYRWVGIHLTVLLLSFILHQMLAFGVNRLLSMNESKKLIDVLFDNPAIWMEIFVYVLFLLVIIMMDYKKTNQEQAVRRAQVESDLINAKLHEVRAKIHPKFLFTTLQTINGLIQQQRNKEANRILSLMSEFLRVTVYDQEREKISFAEELQILHKYLEIEKKRLGSQLHITIDVERSLLTIPVPNFILQPIVEELVNRNLEYSQDSYEIYIHAKKTKKEFVLELGDISHSNIQFIVSDSAKTVFDITQERLRQLYGEKQEFHVEQKADGGISLVMHLPVIENPKELYVEEILEEKL